MLNRVCLLCCLWLPTYTRTNKYNYNKDTSLFIHSQGTTTWNRDVPSIRREVNVENLRLYSCFGKFPTSRAQSRVLGTRIFISVGHFSSANSCGDSHGGVGNASLRINVCHKRKVSRGLEMSYTFRVSETIVGVFRRAALLGARYYPARFTHIERQAKNNC